MSDKVRVLISGRSGQLCTDIQKILNRKENQEKFEVDAFERIDWDVTDREKSKWIFDKIQPNFYLHGASYHVVDQIEKDPVKALDINVASVHDISKLCNEHDTTFVHFSTNYIFGNKDADYKENNCVTRPVCNVVHTPFFGYNGNTSYVPIDIEQCLKEPIKEHEKLNPCNFYGLTKAMAEKTLENDCKKWLNIRVAGLFGKTGSRSKNNTNFPYIILNKLDNLKEGEKIDVVCDQIMSVGYTVDIAESLINLLQNLGSTANHIYCNWLNSHYHVVNEGVLSWFDFAQFILEVLGKDKNLINPISTSTHYSDVKRPLYSALVNTLRPKLPTWQSATIRFLREIGRL